MERNPYEPPREQSWEDEVQDAAPANEQEVSLLLVWSLGGFLIALTSVGAIVAVIAVVALVRAICEL